MGWRQVGAVNVLASRLRIEADNYLMYELIILVLMASGSFMEWLE